MRETFSSAKQAADKLGLTVSNLRAKANKYRIGGKNRQGHYVFTEMDLSYLKRKILNEGSYTRPKKKKKPVEPEE